MKNNGSAVVMVLLFAVIFNILGVGLLELGLTEYRISRNVALYDRLYYHAEAGVEEAVARLPRDGDLFAGYTAVLERAGEPPFFRVEVESAGEGKLIRSVGRAEGKTRLLLVRAGIDLFGGRALLAGGEVRLGRAEVRGHVGAKRIVFVAGENVVHGSLYAKEVRAEWGAGYRLAGGGRVCPENRGGSLDLDFTWYADRAFFFDPRWHIPVIMDKYYWEELGAAGKSLVYVPGDLTVSGEFLFSGVLVVRGSVDWRPQALAGDFVVLAERDIVFGTAAEQAGGSAFFCSGGSIVDGRAKREAPLLLCGALAAAGDIDLELVRVTGSEAALKLYRGELAPGSFSGLAGFTLEYIDPTPRR